MKAPEEIRIRATFAEDSEQIDEVVLLRLLVSAQSALLASEKRAVDAERVIEVMKASAQEAQRMLIHARAETSMMAYRTNEAEEQRDAAIRERDEVGVQLQAAQQMIAQLAKGLPLADLGVVRGKVDDD